MFLHETNQGTEEQIKLKAFPFSLANSAKEGLHYLPSGTITTWNGMKEALLESYFPTSKAANIRKEICGIRQYNGEPCMNTGRGLRNFVHHVHPSDK